MTLHRLFGLHDWMYNGTEFEVQPKRGPFDPTSNADRNMKFIKQVCSQCGLEKRYEAVDSR